MLDLEGMVGVELVLVEWALEEEVLVALEWVVDSEDEAVMCIVCVVCDM